MKSDPKLATCKDCGTVLGPLGLAAVPSPIRWGERARVRVKRRHLTFILLQRRAKTIFTNNQ
jgi:hypothetical protein